MNGPEPRWNLIRRLRKQIATGNYVSTKKLEIVADRLLARLREDPQRKMEGKPDRRL